MMVQMPLLNQLDHTVEWYVNKITFANRYYQPAISIICNICKNARVSQNYLCSKNSLMLWRQC